MDFCFWLTVQLHFTTNHNENTAEFTILMDKFISLYDKFILLNSLFFHKHFLLSVKSKKSLNAVISFSICSLIFVLSPDSIRSYIYLSSRSIFIKSISWFPGTTTIRNYLFMPSLEHTLERILLHILFAWQYWFLLPLYAISPVITIRQSSTLPLYSFKLCNKASCLTQSQVLASLICKSLKCNINNFKFYTTFTQ